MTPNYVTPKFVSTPFGEAMELPLPHDPTKPVIILIGFVNSGTPMWIRLPHQLYKEDLEKLARKHGFREYAVLPCNLADAVWFKWPYDPSRSGTIIPEPL